MRLLPKGQDSPLLWIAKAWHTKGNEAEKHTPHAIGLARTELAIRHILGISSKVGARAPYWTIPTTRDQGLKASRIPKDGQRRLVICTVECPKAMDARIEVDTLLMQGLLHTICVRDRAALHLTPVFNALDFVNRQPEAAQT